MVEEDGRRRTNTVTCDLTRIWSVAVPPARSRDTHSGNSITTGGNTGIGYQTVKQLLLKNAKVYLAARSPEKASEAIKRLEDETKKSAIFLQLDLADLPSVRRAAESFLERESSLDLLFNNGGVIISPNEMLTAQGHDLQFGTNVIGHFFLTELLLPALMKTHRETKIPARIINASSIGHQFAPGKGVEFASLKGGSERDAWLKAAGSVIGPWRLYGENKLSNILISNYFARAQSDVLVSCAVHAGFVNTEFGRHSGSIMQAAGSVFFYPPPMCAYTQLWGATMASPDEINGQYLVPWGAVGKADARASDRQLEDEVIAYVRKQIKGF